MVPVKKNEGIRVNMVYLGSSGKGMKQNPRKELLEESSSTVKSSGDDVGTAFNEGSHKCRRVYGVDCLRLDLILKEN